MLRAQAFEGLFTLVPILLVAVVSIFLRARAARRRKQREEAAAGAAEQGTPARGAPAGGAQARGAQAQGTISESSGQPIPPKRAQAPARTSQFPWQREKADRAPVSAAPFVPGPVSPGPVSPGRASPERPRRPQVANRESYVYPPPLFLNDSQVPTTTAAGPLATTVPRPMVRPSLEGRRAIERMAVPKGAPDLRDRMQARAKLIQPATETRERSTITARLEKLPPLKRAVIWAEILGPPGGRQ